MINWLSLLPTIISAVTAVRTIIDIANSNDDIVTKIKQEVPQIASALEEYGGTFFPSVKQKLQVAAAVMTTFNPDLNKWIQGLLNTASPLLGLPNPNLVVDGFYGQKTMAAAKAVQEKLGVPVDGWFGMVSQNALTVFMSKNVVLK